MTPDMPAMDEKGLKSCPFCGSNEYLSIVKFGSLTGDMPARPYRVVCSQIDHDDVCGPVGYGRPDAIAAWNRRASLRAVPELEVVKADIAEFMRRLGPRWFLEQGWFPASQQAAAGSSTAWGDSGPIPGQHFGDEFDTQPSPDADGDAA